MPIDELMKASRSENQSFAGTGQEMSSLPLPAKQPPIQRSANDQHAPGLRSFAESLGQVGRPEGDKSQPRIDRKKKRALAQPQRHINEPFQDYQKRHFKWRGGHGKMPKDEGKTPPRTWGQIVGDVALGIITAPGIGPAKVLPSLSGGGAAKVSMKTFGIRPADILTFREGKGGESARPNVPVVGKPVESEGGGVTTQDVKAPTPAETGEGAASTVQGATSDPGTSSAARIDWSRYMEEDVPAFDQASQEAFKRQVQLYEKAGVDPFDAMGNGHDSDSSSTSTSPASDNGLTPDYDLVQLYTHESNEYFNNSFRHDGPAGRVNNPEIMGQFADLVESLPRTEGVTLYRGGSGTRGTSGEMFRSGEIKVGDSLVNADFTSFTENPYLTKDYFGGNVDKKPGGYTYDDTSVVFILEQPKDARAIAPLSVTPTEAESMYTPGHAFTVKGIETSTFDGRPLVQVHIAEGSAESGSGKTFDFRTGKPFDREAMVDRLVKNGISAEDANRFFPETRRASDGPQSRAENEIPRRGISS